MGSAAPHPQSLLDALAEGLTTVAVTGTNGKTTTTSMIAAIARAAGERVVKVTTLGMWVDDEQTAEDGSMTSFVHTLERGREVGATCVALEVTSRALAAGFARRWPANVAVLTNLSRDHLDRHGSPERYLAAKAQLFVHLRAGGTAVLNASDPASALVAEVTRPGASVLRYAPRGGDACATLGVGEVEAGVGGSRVVLEGPLAAALGGSLTLAAAGRFNVDNAVAAAVAAHAAGLPAAAIARGLAGFAGVEGRFQVVGRAPLCVVDFAHTPDGLERALDSARELSRAGGGELSCVFGCGGERDRDKRAPMGAIADRLADVVWLTTDNPRGEPPEAIARAIRGGAGGRARWREQPDRRRAIEGAIAAAGSADVVLIAGRGHERQQQLADGPVPLCDLDVARAAHAQRPGQR